ncbi:double-strand break repair helicase AddA, partial [Alsobacter soli]
LVHALLEALPACPPAHRRAAAERLVDARAAGLDAGLRSRLVDDVLAILDAPELAPLFGPGSRAEAPIAGALRLADGAPYPVSGQIDRLAVTADAVLVADFKTGAPGPGDSVPEPYVAQLAVYRALLAQLYPDRPVRCLLVWTAGPKAVEIEGPALDAALARIKPA